MVFQVKIILCLFLLLLLASPLRAWNNGDFGSGDLTGWTPVTSHGAGSMNGCLPSVTVVGNPGNWAIDCLPNQLWDVNNTNVPGTNYSCQLFSGSGDTNFNDTAQVYQVDTVPGGGLSTLSFWFAGVFENYHYALGQLTDDAYLQIDVLAGGNTVGTLKYNWFNNLSQIISTNNTNSAYYAPCAASAPVTWGYVPWTNYQIDLSAYIGGPATLRATMHDCSGGGHYGVGYLDNVAWVANTPSQVTLTKSVNPTGFVSSGQPITYTLSYSNPGASGVAGVEINDTIPAGTTLIPGSVSANPSLPVTALIGNDLIWNINYLAAGSTGTITFQVLPSCASSISNTAKETDLDGGNITSNTVNNTIPTCSPTNTPTVTDTPTVTATASNTPTPTSTGTPTFTPTPTCVTYVWPNPYNPGRAYNGTLKISCMNAQSKVSIFTVSGELIQTLDQSNACQFAGMWGTSYCWDGRNKQKQPVATGVYLYVVQEGDQVIQRGKFLLVNGGS